MGFFSKNKVVTLQEAKLQFNKGNVRKSLKLCKEFLDLNENDFEALNLLGDIYYKNNDKNNSLDIFRKLITKLESDRYTDKAIAVIRKIIRMFPDQYDLYRKLSKLFEKKGFTAEQLKILYELSNIYHENGLDDKAIDILKEIVEIDRSNLNNYLEIIKKFDILGKKFEIAKIIYPALELARQKDNIDATTVFVEIAIKNNSDITDSIKFTTPYFKVNADKINIFNENVKISLLKEFDSLLFTEFISLNNYNLIVDTVGKLKLKYQEMVIYDYLMEQELKTNSPSGLIDLLNEINALPDYLFNSGYSEIIGKYVDSISDIESLDMMVTIAGKSNSKDLQIIIYRKLSNIYKEMNDSEKADSIIEYINELEYSDVGITTSVESTPFGDIEISSEDESSIADLIESTSYNEDKISDDDVFDFDININDDSDNSINDFDLDLTSEESNKENLEIINNSNETDEFDLDLDSDESSEIKLGLEDEKNSIEDDFELVLDDDAIDKEDDNDEIIAELEKFDLNDLPDEEDIFGDIEVEIDISDSISLNDEIKIINSLISDGKTEKAKHEIENLLVQYPDHSELKTINSALILKKTDLNKNNNNQNKEHISDLRYSFKSVAENIRKSIDAQVSLDDYETHYDLAMAYMEMELFDEALEELKKSATGNKKYESLFLMAECYKRMTKFDDSLNIHKLIIIDYNDQNKLKNSLYEMAITYEMKNDTMSANSFFQKISRLDPNFRDVKAKLSGTASSDNEFFKENDNLDILEKESPKVRKKKKISFL